MNNPISGFEEIQPGSYNKQIQLLPGSDERKAKLVDSLDELKNQMEESNRNANQKTRSINKVIIVSSLGLAATLLLTGGSSGKKDSENKKDKGGSSVLRVLKVIGTVVSIGGLLKGIAGMGNSYIDVIEKNSNIKPEELSKNYSSINTQNNKEKDKLIELSISCVMDLILKLNLMTKQSLKSKTRSLRYKKSVGLTKKVIDEILSYEYK